RLSAAQFHAAANQSQGIRDLVVRYNDLLLAQSQQSVACNALHTLEALLQTHDCMDGDVIPLTQEFLGQMLGGRPTTGPLGMPSAAMRPITSANPPGGNGTINVIGRDG